MSVGIIGGKKSYAALMLLVLSPLSCSLPQIITFEAVSRPYLDFYGDPEETTEDNSHDYTTITWWWWTEGFSVTFINSPNDEVIGWTVDHTYTFAPISLMDSSSPGSPLGYWAYSVTVYFPDGPSLTNGLSFEFSDDLTFKQCVITNDGEINYWTTYSGTYDVLGCCAVALEYEDGTSELLPFQITGDHLIILGSTLYRSEGHIYTSDYSISFITPFTQYAQSFAIGYYPDAIDDETTLIEPWQSKTISLTTNRRPIQIWGFLYVDGYHLDAYESGYGLPIVAVSEDPYLFSAAIDGKTYNVDVSFTGPDDDLQLRVNVKPDADDAKPDTDDVPGEIPITLEELTTPILEILGEPDQEETVPCIPSIFAGDCKKWTWDDGWYVFLYHNYTKVFGVTVGWGIYQHAGHDTYNLPGELLYLLEWPIIEFPPDAIG